MSEPAGPTPARTYHVCQAPAADNIASIQRLWMEAFSHLQETSIRRKIDAQYVNNPAGEADCYFLQASDDTNNVGVLCLVKRRFRRNDKTLTAGIMADYVVDSRHRSLSPALQLMKTCLANGTTSLNFIYGFPNKKAEPIFKRVGLNTITQMTRHARLLRSDVQLANRLKGSRLAGWLPVLTPLANLALWGHQLIERYSVGKSWRWQALGQFDDRFDALWQCNTLADITTGVRDSAMLQWRYPSRNVHHIAAAFDNQGGLDGYIIWSLVNDALCIHDFYVDNAAYKLHGMLVSFCWHYRHTGARSVSVEFSGPEPLQAALRKAGFRVREGHPVYLIPGQDDGAANMTGNQWYLTSFDRDSD